MRTATEEDMVAVHAIEFDRDELRSLALACRLGAVEYSRRHGVDSKARALSYLAELFEDEWENPPTEVR